VHTRTRAAVFSTTRSRGHCSTESVLPSQLEDSGRTWENRLASCSTPKSCPWSAKGRGPCFANQYAAVGAAATRNLWPLAGKGVLQQGLTPRAGPRGSSYIARTHSRAANAGPVLGSVSARYCWPTDGSEWQSASRPFQVLASEGQPRTPTADHALASRPHPPADGQRA